MRWEEIEIRRVAPRTPHQALPTCGDYGEPLRGRGSHGAGEFSRTTHVTNFRNNPTAFFEDRKLVREIDHAAGTPNNASDIRILCVIGGCLITAATGKRLSWSEDDVYRWKHDEGVRTVWYVLM